MADRARLDQPREVASLRLGLGEVATRDFLRSELRGLLSDLEDKTEPEAEPAEEPAKPSKPAKKAPPKS